MKLCPLVRVPVVEVHIVNIIYNNWMTWVTIDVLDLCDEDEAEGAEEYRAANKKIQKAVKKAKED